MANEELEALKPALAVIPASDVKTAVNVQSEIIRFTSLTQTADENIDVLTKAGLNPVNVSNLKSGIPAMSSAEALWEMSFGANDSHAQWAAKSDSAFSLRRTLRRDLKHACHDHPELLKVISAMERGQTNDGMLLELGELAQFGAEHTDLLAAIGFDNSKIDTAKSLSSELTAVYANHHLNRGGDQGARDLRDRAFTYCTKSADEICRYGKYAFAEDQNMLAKFTKGWSHNTKSHGKQDDNQTPPPAKT